MFNVYAFDKKKAQEDQHQHDLARSAQIKDRMKAEREKLYENYTKRISDFILHMEKQPIKINNYHSPIENVGRVTDPAKFKGKPHMVVRSFKTHSERVLATHSEKVLVTHSDRVLATNTQSFKLSPVCSPLPQLHIPVTPKLKESTSVKIKPKRMYFKPKNNLERVVDELKSRHVDIFEFEGGKKKKIRSPDKFSPRKTWITLPNYVAEPKEQEKDSVSEEEEIAPKQIFAGLHNKTYFKGVSSLKATDSKYKLKGTLEVYADNILTSCNVRPKNSPKYLKIGEGKLVSNPEESVKETYLKLRSSINTDDEF